MGIQNIADLKTDKLLAKYVEKPNKKSQNVTLSIVTLK